MLQIMSGREYLTQRPSCRWAVDRFIEIRFGCGFRVVNPGA